MGFRCDPIPIDPPHYNMYVLDPQHYTAATKPHTHKHIHTFIPNIICLKNSHDFFVFFSFIIPTGGWTYKFFSYSFEYIGYIIFGWKSSQYFYFLIFCVYLNVFGDQMVGISINLSCEIIYLWYDDDWSNFDLNHTLYNFLGVVIVWYFKRYFKVFKRY